MIPQDIIERLDSELKLHGLTGRIVYEESADPTRLHVSLTYIEDGQDPKKLFSRWTPEAAQNLESFGIDIKEEILKAISKEVIYELTRK